MCQNAMIKEKSTKVPETVIRKKLLLLAVLLTLLEFAVLYWKFPLMINGDDYMEELALSGGYNGTLLSLYPYNNILLVKAISKLYGLSNIFPFYSGFLVMVLYVSCTVIHYSFFCAVNKKNYPLWIAEIIYLIAYFTYIISSVATISYTLIAGICGCSAVALILSSDYSEKGFKAKSCAAILLSLLACLIRPESGYVPLCFLLLSYVFVILKNCVSKDEKIGKNHITSIVLFFTIALGAVFACSYLDKLLRDESDARFIADWNKGRSIIVDFKGLSYEEDSKFLNSIGWNEEFFDLEETFYNLDSKCDYAHYSAIQQYAESKPEPTLFAVIGKTFLTIIGYAKSMFFLPLFGIIAVLLAYCLKRVIDIGIRNSIYIYIYRLRVRRSCAYVDVSYIYRTLCRSCVPTDDYATCSVPVFRGN